MKKKIILMCALVVMCLCIFAISASASSFDFVSNGDYEIKFDNDVSVNTVTYEKNDVISTFHVLSVTDVNYNICYYIQPIEFKEFCDTIFNKQNLTFLEFSNFFRENSEYVKEDCSIISYFSFSDDGYNGYDESFFNKLYYYRDITEEDLESKYSTGYSDGLTQGKIDGVTEFKTTEEYKSQYTTGYTEGVSNFKSSEEYKEALLLEKQIGQAEGKSLYLESEEYENALQAEYDNGYDTAVKDQSKAEFKTEFVTLIGSLGLIILVLSVIFVFSGKKHKKK